MKKKNKNTATREPQRQSFNDLMREIGNPELSPLASLMPMPTMMNARMTVTERGQEPGTVTETVTIPREEYDALNEASVIVGLLRRMANTSQSDFYLQHLVRVYDECRIAVESGPDAKGEAVEAKPDTEEAAD